MQQYVKEKDALGRETSDGFGSRVYVFGGALEYSEHYSAVNIQTLEDLATASR